MTAPSIHALARPEVLPLPAYNAGLSSAAVRVRYGVTDIARLASNENPHGPSPAVARALVDLAVAGRGIVFAPAFAVAEQVERNALAEVLPGWTAQVDLGDAVVALTLAHGVVPPAARVLVDFVRAPLAGS